MTTLEKYIFPVCFLIIIIGFTCGLCAQEVPPWALRGMAKIETGSYYKGDALTYVNQRRGTAGEVGAFQALPSTLRQFKMSPSLFEQDIKYAESCVLQILTTYYNRCGNWDQAVGAWRKGYGGRLTKTAKDYAKKAKELGSK